MTVAYLTIFRCRLRAVSTPFTHGTLAIIVFSCLLTSFVLANRADAGSSRSQATVEVTSIDPELGTRVGESTTIKATLHYAIEGFVPQPHTYTAGLLFDDPMDLSGKSTYFSDFGCRGATQTLPAASGTITLECHLKEVWRTFRHSKHMGFGFVITQSNGGSNSIGIARIAGGHYDIER